MTVYVQDWPTRRLRRRLNELQARPASYEAARELGAVLNELQIRDMDRRIRTRRQEQALRPVEKPTPVAPAPAESEPKPSGPPELEARRAALALEHQRTGDPEVLTKLEEAEAELAEAERTAERQAVARREEARVAAEVERQREERARSSAERRAATLQGKRHKLMAEIEEATGGLVALLRQDADLRGELHNTLGELDRPTAPASKELLVSWLQGRLNEVFPMDFPRGTGAYGTDLRELVG